MREDPLSIYVIVYVRMEEKGPYSLDMPQPHYTDAAEIMFRSSSGCSEILSKTSGLANRKFQNGMDSILWNNKEKKKQVGRVDEDD